MPQRLKTTHNYEGATEPLSRIPESLTGKSEHQFKSIIQ